MTDLSSSRGTAVPRWLRHGTDWAWRLLVLATAIVACGWALLRLRVVFVPALVALLLASALTPPAAALRRRGIPALVSTWVVFLALAAAIGGAGWLVTSSLSGELGEREQWTDVRSEVRDWLQDGPLGLSRDQVAQLEDRVRDGLARGVSVVDADRIHLIVDVATGVLLALVLTFFFVKDGDAMWSWAMRRIHPARREAADTAGRAAFGALGSYMRGVAITGAVDAVAIGVGLLIIGVPLALPLAGITFVASFFPIVGATTAGALAATVALVTNGPGDALLVALLTLVVQQVEGDVIMPLVMARQVRLHPAAILTALAVGGAVAGIVGAFVAVPTAAMATAAGSSLRTGLDPPPEG